MNKNLQYVSFWVLILCIIFCNNNALEAQSLQEKGALKMSKLAADYNMNNNYVTDCTGTLYDSGGANGDYQSNEDYTFTICPEETNGCISLSFVAIDTEGGLDEITIYNGANTDPDSVAKTLSGFQVLNTTYVQANCATITFKSDGSIQNSGWIMVWDCNAPNCDVNDGSDSPQDCINAIPICQNQYYEENAYLGTGNIPEEISGNTSCLSSGEKNDVWYTFTVQESGDLGFTLTPNNGIDDYDWAVYNITNAECSNIAIDGTLEVSCNYSADGGVTGPTGATDIISGTASDENQNALIPVTVGETYVINISQYEDISQSGYTLDFSIATAQINDLLRPTVKKLSADPICGGTEVGIKFSENILCSSVQATDFEFIAYNGINYTWELNTSICENGGGEAYERDHYLTLTPALSPGNYAVALIDTVLDVCGNVGIYPDTLFFSIQGTNFEGTANKTTFCYNEPVLITINGTGNYNFYTTEGAIPQNLIGSGTSIDITALINGGETYNLLVTQVGDGGCESTPQTIPVTRLNATVAELNIPASVCLLPNETTFKAQLADNATEGGTFLINNGATINAQTGEINLSTIIPNTTYTITYVISGLCPASSFGSIKFLAQPAVLTLSNFECLNNATDEFTFDLTATDFAGTVQVNDTNLSATFAGNGTETQTLQLPSNGTATYTLTITDLVSQCQNTQTFVAPQCPNCPVLPTPLTVSNFDCLNDNTDNFTADLTANNFSGTAYISEANITLSFEGGATETKSVTLPSNSGANYTIVLTDATTQCQNVQTFVAPQCPDCNPQAGTMPTNIVTVCYGNSVNIATNGDEVLENGMIQMYALHNSPTAQIGNIVATNPNGNFTNNGTVAYNQTYYVSSIVGFDYDGNGMPDLNNICTDVAQGTPLVFLAPLKFDIDEHCDFKETGDFTITAMVSGGLPAFNTQSTYTIQGDFNGEIGHNETFTIVTPEDAPDSYQFFATDLNGCATDTTREFYCEKTPLELLRFEATPKNTNASLLTWSVATQVNIKSYTLKAATNGINFETIALVNATDNSTETQNYNYTHTHNNPATNTIYYQLFATDFNNNTQLVATTSLNLEHFSQNNELKINKLYFSNNNNLHLQFTPHSPQLPTTITVFNTIGKKIIVQKIAENQTMYILPLQNNLPSGVYFVVLQNGTHTKTQKVVR